MAETFAVQADVRAPWRRFIDDVAPLRPDLYRYCRGLTGNVWDAEDLAQDALLRVFGQLGKLNSDVENPRAYLIRTATNLWLDRIRHFGREQAHVADTQAEPREEGPDASQVVDVRTAASRLFLCLAPRERASVMLVDVLDFSLAEAASLLKSTIGAVKAALHRGRQRLRDRVDLDAPALPANPSCAPRSLIDRFVAALAARDLDAIRDMCLADITFDMVGGATFDGYEAGRSTLEFAHFVMPDWGFGENPNWRVVDIEGEAVVAGFRTMADVEGLNEVWRLEVDGEAISRVRLYCFNPEVIGAVADELGTPALQRPYRSPP
jgi:RNA polymerase sigma-70 factor (ECF subfamily)